MIKSALLIGMSCLSFNVFAASLTDLNSALHQTNLPATQQVVPKMLYGGQDMQGKTIERT